MGWARYSRPGTENEGIALSVVSSFWILLICLGVIATLIKEEGIKDSWLALIIFGPLTLYVFLWFIDSLVLLKEKKMLSKVFNLKNLFSNPIIVILEILLSALGGLFVGFTIGFVFLPKTTSPDVLLSLGFLLVYISLALTAYTDYEE